MAMPQRSCRDGFEPEGEVTGNVFEEDPLGGTFPDNTDDFGPEMTGIVGTAALASDAEGLAGWRSR